MKAIIFNSGQGTRLHPFTKKHPKCLIKLDGKTLLEHEIDALLAHNIKDIIITVGPFDEQIEELVKTKYPEVKATYVKNELYDSTNSTYTLSLLQNLVDDDVIMMHGDLVFDKKLVGLLLASEHPTCGLVETEVSPPFMSFYASLTNGIISGISAQAQNDDDIHLLPLYKISLASFNAWKDQVDVMLKTNQSASYAEYAIPLISEQIQLKPVYYSNEFCEEIDDFTDLKNAEVTLKQYHQKQARNNVS